MSWIECYCRQLWFKLKLIELLFRHAHRKRHSKKGKCVWFYDRKLPSAKKRNPFIACAWQRNACVESFKENASENCVGRTLIILSRNIKGDEIACLAAQFPYFYAFLRNLPVVKPKVSPNSRPYKQFIFLSFKFYSNRFYEFTHSSDIAYAAHQPFFH